MQNRIWAWDCRGNDVDGLLPRTSVEEERLLLSSAVIEFSSYDLEWKHTVSELASNAVSLNSAGLRSKETSEHMPDRYNN